MPRVSPSPLAILLALAALAAPARARADDAPETRRRTLRGHVFPRPVTDDSAFLATTAGFRQGVLLVSAGKVNAYNGRRPYRRAAALESLDTTIAITDWFGVAATGDLQAVVAASEVALYSGPSEIAGGLKLGPVVRALHVARSGTQVTLRPYHRTTVGTYADPSAVFPLLRDRLADEITNEPGTRDEVVTRLVALEADLFRSATTPIRQTGFGASVHVAQGLAPALGLQLSYGLERSAFTASPYDLASLERRSFRVRTLTHRVTFAVTLDGSPYGVPFALGLEGVVVAGHLSAEGVPSTALDTTVLLGPGLHYTGSRTAQIGVFVATELGVSAYLTPYGRTEAPSVHYAQFAFRHFF